MECKPNYRVYTRQFEAICVHCASSAACPCRPYLAEVGGTQVWASFPPCIFNEIREFRETLYVHHAIANRLLKFKSLSSVIQWQQPCTFLRFGETASPFKCTVLHFCVITEFQNTYLTLFTFSTDVKQHGARYSHLCLLATVNEPLEPRLAAVLIKPHIIKAQYWAS